jgi:hypothetical protein
LILLSRLIGLDPALEEAAMDLGASYPPRSGAWSCLPGPSLLSAADLLHRLV